jgi:hypothetical protein
VVDKRQTVSSLMVLNVEKREVKNINLESVDVFAKFDHNNIYK